jgi:hypothetical protein
MVCGGFACSRNALCALNVVYMVRFWKWINLRGGKNGGVSRGLPAWRGVYWGFWEASQKLPAKREFLGTSVEEDR